MKKLVAASLLALLAACGGGGGGGSASPAASQPVASPARAEPTSFGAYSVAQQIVGGSYTTESELVAEPVGYSIFYSCQTNALCRIARADLPGAVSSSALLPKCRFPYLFDHEGVHYLTCGLTDFAGDVYLFTSADMNTWTLANGGNPILRQAPGTQWANIWNAAILPIGNRWHMLAETSPTPDRMDLAYAYADFGPSVDFTPHQGAVVIPNGGNPALLFKAGKMLAVHGMYRDSLFSGAWYVTMSEADPSAPAAWTVRRDKLLIGENGIDIADPSYLEVGGHALITISYDQRKAVLLRGPVLTP
jgi:hypothetical protein